MEQDEIDREEQRLAEAEELFVDWMQCYKPAPHITKATKTITTMELMCQFSENTGCIVSLGEIARFMKDMDYKIENLAGTGNIEWLLIEV